MKCQYCSDFDTVEPELNCIEMFEGYDPEGCNYYFLDVIKDCDCDIRRLYIRYCPMCGRKLIEDEA